MKGFLHHKTVLGSFLLFLSFFLAGCGLKGGNTLEGEYKVSLEIWGVFDDSDAYNEAIAEYVKLNPHVGGIQYRKLSPETYKEDLIEAFAAGKGPDIFMIRNAWRAPFENKTAPAPDRVLTERDYKESLVDVAATDFIGTANKIYGIPLSVDSLGLYYNKDLFNAAGIAQPPTTWDEVAEDVRKLTELDQFGNITRSGIALGTGANINRASDILMLLMMQFGAEIGGREEGEVNFSARENNQALEYYTQFSRIGSSSYVWNARQHYSIDSFYEGTTAMMINYSWQYETLKQKNAKLNIGVAPLPQLNPATPVNVANYWGFAVSKDKPTNTVVVPTVSGTASLSAEKLNELRVFESWQFLKYLALSGEKKSIQLVNGRTGTVKDFPLSFDPTERYLEKTHKPAARRDLVAAQSDALTLAPFSYGNLIAKSWYQGNPEAADGILIDMIESVNRGEKSGEEALYTAANRINLLSR